MYTTLTFCLRIVMDHLVVLFRRLVFLWSYTHSKADDISLTIPQNLLLILSSCISHIFSTYCIIIWIFLYRRSWRCTESLKCNKWTGIETVQPFLELQYYKSQCQLEHCQILHTLYWMWLLTFPVFSPWVTLVRLCWKAFVTHINYTVTSNHYNKIYMEAS